VVHTIFYTIILFLNIPKILRRAGGTPVKDMAGGTPVKDMNCFLQET
jgi:hypothetical protein